MNPTRDGDERDQVGLEEGGHPSPEARNGRPELNPPEPVEIQSISPDVPNRYRIRENESGRVLTCVEAPTIQVRVERGFSVTGNAARKYPPGSIFLDGTAQAEPFLDSSRHIFNLDHHEGCIRAFTLATCEQTVVLIRKGMDLRARDWTIYANEPDLDTVLAIWVFLNHMRITDQDPEIRRKVMPLLRLQGTIDAHGLELQDLTGFAEEKLNATFALLEQLREEEVALKKEGRWQEIDFLHYTAEVLVLIDSLIYSSEDFAGVIQVEELARAEIAPGRLAIVCRSETGIYGVEKHLRRLHGNRLGIIALEKGTGIYTLRQIDSFLPRNLESVYEQLNLIDPAVGNTRSSNRWGGSTEIGGSPRTSGSRLRPEQIAEACRKAYRTPTARARFAAIVEAAMATAAALLSPMLALVLQRMLGDGVGPLEELFAKNVGHFATILFPVSIAVFLLAARKGPGIYGLRLPSGLDWIPLALVCIAGAFAGGAWASQSLLSKQAILGELDWLNLVIALSFPVTAEVLFRGLAHGILVQHFRIQLCGGPWLLSWPVILSSLLYATWTIVPLLPFGSSVSWIGFLGALVFGVAAGMMRERSESILPPIVVHWICLALVVLVPWQL